MGERRQGKLGEGLLAGQWRSGLQVCFTRLGDSGSSRIWENSLMALEDGWKMAERFLEKSPRRMTVA